MERNDDFINICYCGNDKMFYGVLLSALSVSYVSIKPVRVYILTAELKCGRKHYLPFLDEQAKRIETLLKRHNPQNEVILKDVKDLFLKDFHHCINFHSTYTPYAYMRLVLDDMKDMPSRILYMDTDTIAVKSIEPLFELDMTHYDIGMVPDQVGKHYFGKRYGNSGILLINLDNVRKHSSFVKARWRVNHIRMFMPDQTALNIVCGRLKTKLMLPGKYNEQLDMKEDTVIRHYCKRMYWFPIIHTINIKPWNVDAFRKRFGENTHKTLLDEFLTEKEECERKGIVDGKITPAKKE